MKKLTLVMLAAMAITAFAADTKVQGYLVDIACADEDGQKAGFGAKHTKDCLLMPECVKSGYGLLTDDKKVFKFDKAGNEKAKQFIAGLKKDKDIKVDVTGTINGENITVTKIDLQ
ncbi:MAG: hypothetical protein LAO78_28855 [Acidobacteriia bacterium]|nr:hypothetical protein [Terriglobia bacterium]